MKEGDLVYCVNKSIDFKQLGFVKRVPKRGSIYFIIYIFSKREPSYWTRDYLKAVKKELK